MLKLEQKYIRCFFISKGKPQRLFALIVRCPAAGAFYRTVSLNNPVLCGAEG